MRRQSRPEDAIQRAVVQHLRMRGVPNLFFLHIPNGGKRKPIEAAIMKGLGVRAGAPDLLMLDNGVCFGLELKAESGRRPTAVQQDTLEAMRKAGAHVAVAYGLDAALSQLEGWGLLRGVAT